jgi:DNA-binding GntR family transcriptional regulator
VPMPASVRCRQGSQTEDVAELRLLIELRAVRRLTARGLSDQELALVTARADATLREARRADVAGYVRADTAFHLCLLRLTGGPALCDVARLLLAPGRVSPPGAEESRYLTADAREHGQLIGMVADGMVSAADDLLRLHLSRLAIGRPEPDVINAAGA